jgi:hypothetical protein
MSKARTLAGTVSTGAVLADGTVDASEIGSLTLPTGGDIVGTTSTQTLTNKTIDIASNTLTGVQASLVSGTSIKTINGGSVLGSGDLAVGGGSMILISSITASNSASVSFTNINSTYAVYVLEIVNAIPSVASDSGLRFSSDNGSTYFSGGTDYAYSLLRNRSDDNAPNGVGVSGNSVIDMGFSDNSTLGAGLNATVKIFNPARAANTLIQFQVANTYGTSTSQQILGSAFVLRSTAKNAIRYFFNSGNIASGIFRLYGIKSN